MWTIGYTSTLGYHLAIDPGTETSCFGVLVLELFGCFSAGDTLEEAVRNADESIALWLECAKRNGKIVIPSPNSQLSVLFDSVTDKMVTAFTDDEINEMAATGWMGREVSFPATRQTA
jgi:predicted RNase H-like HicB family nuclease